MLIKQCYYKVRYYDHCLKSEIVAIFMHIIIELNDIIN